MSAGSSNAGIVTAVGRPPSVITGVSRYDPDEARKSRPKGVVEPTGANPEWFTTSVEKAPTGPET